MRPQPAQNTPESVAEAEPGQHVSTPAVPLLQEMPFEFQSTVPSVRIDALVYSEDAGGRMVFIGNHKYVEGQQVEGNLRLDKITREGVVLSYQGQQFLLRP